MSGESCEVPGVCPLYCVLFVIVPFDILGYANVIFLFVLVGFSPLFCGLWFDDRPLRLSKAARNPICPEVGRWFAGLGSYPSTLLSCASF